MRAAWLLVTLIVAAPDRQPVGPVEMAKKPQDLILGHWSYENRAIGSAPAGKPSPADGLTANVVIDWSQNPVAIDFIPKRGGNKMMGILKLEGDHLILAI